MNSTIKKDKRLYVIYGITLMMVMGVASLTPAFPKIARVLRLSEAQTAMLISVFTLPGIFLTPLTGILGDRFGRKPVLIPSLVVFAAAGFGCFFARDFELLLILRFIQGIGASALGALNMALIADFYDGKDRAAVMGYNASVLSLGTATYPFVGGLLAGLAWYGPFLLPLAALPVAIALIYLVPEPPASAHQTLGRYMRQAGRSLLRKEVIGLFLISIFTFVILYGAFLSYFPFLLQQRFQLGPAQIGMLLSLSSLSTAVTSSRLGKLVQRFSELKLLKTAFVLYALVCLLMPNIGSLYLITIPVILFGIAQGINLPSLQTLLANLAPPEQRAVFLSINGTVLRVGQTLGPVIIGAGFAFSGISGAFYLAAVVALVMLVAIFILLKNLAAAVEEMH